MNRIVTASAWLAAALLASSASLRTAHAQSVTSLDSDRFAPGTNVSNAFQGVTLEAMSLVPDLSAPPSPFTTWMPSYSPVYAAVGDFFSSVSTGSSGWGALFGPLDGSCFQSCAGPQGNDFGTNLLLNFSAPVDQINVSQIGNAFNGVALEAFNSFNQEVGYCVAAPGGDPGPGNYGCYSVLSNHAGDSQWQVTTSLHAPDISKVVIGAFNNGGDQVDTIRYMAAPEIDPASLASGLTLLLGGLLVLRGRRPARLERAAN
jgi:hypothetical protein